ncbi:alpha beta hydrolase [Diplodia corticola]|uniref:Alpha beta hydrolase n=1 Tax=Diplodia corticola TaxID=236234 RepID=A0A1J9RFC7_9PEZI|nr:alpha beta hydrolase [Diplodia corticola]OJD40222.1 alpha beta hydrolase [Diplodia corticola]
MFAAKTLLLPLLALAGLVQSSPLAARQSEAWKTLPATPKLPSPISSTKASINGAQLWFQKYNEAAGGTPIVFIHGGLGYSAYFGDVISSVSKTHYVIAVDRRGHGRSTYGANDKFTFEMFAKDTHDLLKAQGVSQAAWVGWSDGAATTLAGLLDSTIAPSITKAFVFAGFQSFADTNATFTDTTIYSDFVSRCATEYAALQPTAKFSDFASKVGTLEATLPTWTDADLAKIDGKKVTISGADHDEAVNLAVPKHLNSVIAGSKLVMMTGVSHFAPAQDPVQFSQKIESFIAA